MVDPEPKVVVVVVVVVVVEFISSEDFKEKRDCPSDLLAPIETMKRTKSKQVKKAVAKKKIDGPEKLLKKNRNEKPTTRGIFSWSPIQVLTPPKRT